MLDDRVTYIGVGRDPRDAAMSELAQWDNMDLDRMRALQGAGTPAPAPDRLAPPAHPDSEPSPVDAFRRWMEGPIIAPEGPNQLPERPLKGPARPPDRRADGPGHPPPGLGHPPLGPGHPPPGPGMPSDGMALQPDAMGMPPVKHMGSLANIMHHFGSVWSRRHLPNVAMFHYADYQQDLAGELARLGAALGLDVGRDRAEALAQHATLGAMRARATELAPDSTEGIWRSNERFFRAGGRGEWRQFFTEEVYRRYIHRADLLSRQCGGPDLLAWAHEGRRGHDPA